MELGVVCTTGVRSVTCVVGPHVLEPSIETISDDMRQSGRYIVRMAWALIPEYYREQSQRIAPTPFYRRLFNILSGQKRPASNAFQLWHGQLRETLHFMEPENYRGIGRGYLRSGISYGVDEEVSRIEAFYGIDFSPKDNLRAREYMAKLEERYQYDTQVIVPCQYSAAELLKAYDLLDSKHEYEIIEVTEGKKVSDISTLGFDVGSLSYGYSVIADAAIMPNSYPPVIDAMADIVEQLKKLNQHCLFSKYQDASDYLALYNRKVLGAKGEYCVVQVRLLMPESLQN